MEKDGGGSAMVPGIWTDFVPDEPLPDALRFMHACGWQCFEISTEDLEEIDAEGGSEARLEDIQAVLSELHVSMPQGHAYLHADVAHPDENRREADRATLVRHMTYCARLGVENVVVHPGGRGYTTDEELERVFQHNVSAFKLLAVHAGENGLRIGIENMFEPPGRDERVFGSRVDELLDLIAAVDSPAAGITFDTSHANVEGIDLPAAVRAFGDLICCTHISDNDGSGDQHRMPGCGNIDWPPFVAALREVGYDGIFNLEIPGESHPAPRVRSMKLRHALDLTRRLVDAA